MPQAPGMNPTELSRERPDVVAALHGGDPQQRMHAEPDIDTANRESALLWSGTYREILAFERGVLSRMTTLMVLQSPASRREVETSNVPVIVAQVERFRLRLGYWEARLSALDAQVPA